MRPTQERKVADLSERPDAAAGPSRRTCKKVRVEFFANVRTPRTETIFVVNQGRTTIILAQVVILALLCRPVELDFRGEDEILVGGVLINQLPGVVVEVNGELERIFSGSHLLTGLGREG